MQRSPDFDSPHGFFSRQGGVSSGFYQGLNCGLGSSDDRSNIQTNRGIVTDTLAEGSHAFLVTPYQTHSNICKDLSRKDLKNAGHTPDNPFRPKADALVTDEPGLIIGVVTADCVPILFSDKRKKIIGAAHAGWRGALLGIIEATIEGMMSLGSNPCDIVAATGPAINQNSYEVGADMFNAVTSGDIQAASFFKQNKKPDQFHFDLKAYCCGRLAHAGVHKVWTSETDTYTSPDHFSFRRSCHMSENDFGRQISAIML